jgi:LmbE family N-acetylglucosaminyl deacetylase
MNILALIAHPDDLEIAAAGTICQLVEDQHNVLIAVATDEACESTRKVRQAEAINAAQCMGLSASHILFLGQEDRFAANTLHWQQILQAWVQSHDIQPDIVITHSKNDTHQDHRAIRKLAMSAFEDTASLFLFAAVVNSLRQCDFSPSIFVDTDRHWQNKRRALACYPSQDVLGRIRINDIDRHERHHAAALGTTRVEAFEAILTHPVKAMQLLRQFALQHAAFSGEKTTESAAVAVTPVRTQQAETA